VYISIDKDVLDHRHAVTDWDQGVMRLDQLLELLRHILVRKHVHGIDICGELPASPLERLRPDYMKASEKNERTNSRILAALLGFSKNARFRQGKKAVFGKS
jgi:arginase family enzyme